MDLASLNERISRLEALEAIKRLKYQYFFNCDQKRPAEVRKCFADGEVDIDFGRIGTFTRADDLVAVFEQLACSEHIVEMHHAQNPQIDIESETEASGLWGLYYYMIDTNQGITTQLGAYYEDRYRCIAGAWKIVATRCVVTSTQILEMSGERVAAVYAGISAPAELDDPSKQAG